MTFARLTRGDWLAGIAALALLLVLSATWYSTDAGVEAREIEQNTEPRGATAGEVGRAVDERAKTAADEAEQSAWEPDALADRLVLFALLAAIALAVAAAWLRAAGVRFKQPFTPSALTAGVGLFAVMLLAFRILQKPSAEAGAVIKAGAPIGLVCVGLLTLGARAAWKAERDGSAWADNESGDAAGDGDVPEREAVSRPAPLLDAAAPAPGATATLPRPVAGDAPSAPAAGDPDSGWAPDWADEPAAPPSEAPTAAEPSGRRKRRAEKKWRRRGL